MSCLRSVSLCSQIFDKYSPCLVPMETEFCSTRPSIHPILKIHPFLILRGWWNSLASDIWRWSRKLRRLPYPWRPAPKGYAARFYLLTHNRIFLAKQAFPCEQYFFRSSLVDCFALALICAARVCKRLFVGKRLLLRLGTLRRHFGRTMAGPNNPDILLYRTQIRN